jgi:8-oxo-dGTP pyrophosphatase MutT (NUDIX family)
MWSTGSVEHDVGPFMAPGPTTAAASGLPPRGDLTGRRHHRFGADVVGIFVGDGNGWVRCSHGHRHWGRFGAAGLLITHGDEVLLQHRAPWTHEGDSWAVPGGAKDSHEDSVTAALREAAEETTLDPDAVTPWREWVDDHGGWSYTTIVATTGTALPVRPINGESTAMRWWPIADVAELPLHRGFAATWPALRSMLELR